MKETILLFNPPEKEKLLKIEMALFPLHVRLKKVKPDQYCQPLGVLAGIKDMVPAEGTYEGGEGATGVISPDAQDNVFYFRRNHKYVLTGTSTSVLSHELD